MSRPPEILGEFEQLVLFALFRLGDDAYGATIRREIETRTGRELAISAVYVTLDRLETKGLVKSRVGDPSPTRGGRRRKHFALLQPGRRAAGWPNGPMPVPPTARLPVRLHPADRPI